MSHKILDSIHEIRKEIEKAPGGSSTDFSYLHLKGKLNSINAHLNHIIKEVPECSDAGWEHTLSGVEHCYRKLDSKYNLLPSTTRSRRRSSSGECYEFQDHKSEPDYDDDIMIIDIIEDEDIKFEDNQSPLKRRRRRTVIEEQINGNTDVNFTDDRISVGDSEEENRSVSQINEEPEEVNLEYQGEEPNGMLEKMETSNDLMGVESQNKIIELNTKIEQEKIIQRNLQNEENLIKKIEEQNEIIKQCEENLKKTIEENNIEKTTLNETIVELTVHIKRRDKSFSKNEQEIKNLKHSCQNNETEKISKEAKIQSLEDIIKNKDAEIEGLRKSELEKEADIGALKDKNQRIQNRFTELKRMVEESDIQQKTWNEENKLEVERLRLQIADGKTELHKIENKRLEAVLAEREKFDKMRKDYEIVIESFKQLDQDQKLKIQELERVISSFSRKIKN